MSRRNREKRAAKQKERRQAAAGRGRRASGPGPDWRDETVLHERLVYDLYEAAMCSEHESDWHAKDLLNTVGGLAGDLDIVADIAMQLAIRTAWEQGWLPSDLSELARRRLRPLTAGYLVEAIVLECAQYSVATLHPSWRAEIATLSAGVDCATRIPQLRRWATRTSGSRRAALVVVLDVLALLGTLRPLEALLPLPGEQHYFSATAADGVDAKALGRVRALLAKAEATEYAEEAEALSAKAQELMSRYSLHAGMADHDRGRVPVAAGQRMWMESPYAGAKALLVQSVATANRCRAVWSEDFGFVTVIGSETDLKLVELLVTSLLVQANRAMLAAGRRVGDGGTARTRSFRQSFLVAYATRIGERLDTANATVTAEVRDDSRLLPVLAARNRAADELTDRLFPSMVHRPVSVSNGAGWVAGRAAADLALFDVHDPIAG